MGRHVPQASPSTWTEALGTRVQRHLDGSTGCIAERAGNSLESYAPVPIHNIELGSVWRGFTPRRMMPPRDCYLLPVCSRDLKIICLGKRRLSVDGLLYQSLFQGYTILGICSFSISIKGPVDFCQPGYRHIATQALWREHHKVTCPDARHGDTELVFLAGFWAYIGPVPSFYATISPQ